MKENLRLKDNIKAKLWKRWKKKKKKKIEKGKFNCVKKKAKKENNFDLFNLFMINENVKFERSSKNFSEFARLFSWKDTFCN